MATGFWGASQSATERAAREEEARLAAAVYAAKRKRPAQVRHPKGNRPERPSQRPTPKQDKARDRAKKSTGLVDIAKQLAKAQHDREVQAGIRKQAQIAAAKRELARVVANKQAVWQKRLDEQKQQRTIITNRALVQGLQVQHAANVRRKEVDLQIAQKNRDLAAERYARMQLARAKQAEFVARHKAVEQAAALQRHFTWEDIKRRNHTVFGLFNAPRQPVTAADQRTAARMDVQRNARNALDTAGKRAGVYDVKQLGTGKLLEREIKVIQRVQHDSGGVDVNSADLSKVTDRYVVYINGLHDRLVGYSTKFDAINERLRHVKDAKERKRLISEFERLRRSADYRDLVAEVTRVHGKDGRGGGSLDELTGRLDEIEHVQALYRQAQEGPAQAALAATIQGMKEKDKRSRMGYMPDGHGGVVYRERTQSEQYDFVTKARDELARLVGNQALAGQRKADQAHAAASADPVYRYIQTFFKAHQIGPQNFVGPAGEHAVMGVVDDIMAQWYSEHPVGWLGTRAESMPNSPNRELRIKREAEAQKFRAKVYEYMQVQDPGPIGRLMKIPLVEGVMNSMGLLWAGVGAGVRAAIPGEGGFDWADADPVQKVLDVVEAFATLDPGHVFKVRSDVSPEAMKRKQDALDRLSQAFASGNLSVIAQAMNDFGQSPFQGGDASDFVNLWAGFVLDPLNKVPLNILKYPARFRAGVAAMGEGSKLRQAARFGQHFIGSTEHSLENRKLWLELSEQAGVKGKDTERFWKEGLSNVDSMSDAHTVVTDMLQKAGIRRKPANYDQLVNIAAEEIMRRYESGGIKFLTDHQRLLAEGVAKQAAADAKAVARKAAGLRREGFVRGVGEARAAKGESAAQAQARIQRREAAVEATRLAKAERDAEAAGRAAPEPAAAAPEPAAAAPEPVVPVAAPVRPVVVHPAPAVPVLAKEPPREGWRVGSRTTPQDMYFPPEAKEGSFWFAGVKHGDVPKGPISKVHVAATPATAQGTLVAVDDIARDMGVSYKFVQSPDALKPGSPFGHGSKQVGKFVTAYPKQEDAAEFVRRVDNALRQDGIGGAEVAPNEVRYLDDSMVTHRYAPDARARQTDAERYAPNGGYDAEHPDFVGPPLPSQTFPIPESGLRGGDPNGVHWELDGGKYRVFGDPYREPGFVHELETEAQARAVLASVAKRKELEHRLAAQAEAKRLREAGPEARRAEVYARQQQTAGKVAESLRPEPVAGHYVDPGKGSKLTLDALPSPKGTKPPLDQFVNGGGGGAVSGVPAAVPADHVIVTDPRLPVGEVGRVPERVEFTGVRLAPEQGAFTVQPQQVRGFTERTGIVVNARGRPKPIVSVVNGSRNADIRAIEEGVARHYLGEVVSPNVVGDGVVHWVPGSVAQQSDEAKHYLDVFLKGNEAERADAYRHLEQLAQDERQQALSFGNGNEADRWTIDVPTEATMVHMGARTPEEVASAQASLIALQHLRHSVTIVASEAAKADAIARAAEVPKTGIMAAVFDVRQRRLIRDPYEKVRGLAEDVIGTVFRDGEIVPTRRDVAKPEQAGFVPTEGFSMGEDAFQHTVVGEGAYEYYRPFVGQASSPLDRPEGYAAMIGQMTPWRFEDVLAASAASWEAAGMGAFAFRRSQQRLFELFHYLRRAQPDVMEQLHDVAVLHAFEPTMLDGEVTFGHATARMWLLMESRAGMRMALAWDVVERAFGDAALRMQMHEGLALSMLPGPYRTKVLGSSFQLTGVLNRMRDAAGTIVSQYRDLRRAMTPVRKRRITELFGSVGREMSGAEMVDEAYRLVHWNVAAYNGIRKGPLRSHLLMEGLSDFIAHAEPEDFDLLYLEYERLAYKLVHARKMDVARVIPREGFRERLIRDAYNIKNPAQRVGRDVPREGDPVRQVMGPKGKMVDVERRAPRKRDVGRNAPSVQVVMPDGTRVRTSGSGPGSLLQFRGRARRGAVVAEDHFQNELQQAFEGLWDQGKVNVSSPAGNVLFAVYKIQDLDGLDGWLPRALRLQKAVPPGVFRVFAANVLAERAAGYRADLLRYVGSIGRNDAEARMWRSVGFTDEQEQILEGHARARDAGRAIEEDDNRIARESLLASGERNMASAAYVGSDVVAGHREYMDHLDSMHPKERWRRISSLLRAAYGDPMSEVGRSLPSMRGRFGPAQETGALMSAADREGLVELVGEIIPRITNEERDRLFDWIGHDNRVRIRESGRVAAVRDIAEANAATASRDEVALDAEKAANAQRRAARFAGTAAAEPDVVAAMPPPTGGPDEVVAAAAAPDVGGAPPASEPVIPQPGRTDPEPIPNTRGPTPIDWHARRKEIYNELMKQAPQAWLAKEYGRLTGLIRRGKGDAAEMAAWRQSRREVVLAQRYHKLGADPAAWIPDDLGDRLVRRAMRKYGEAAGMHMAPRKISVVARTRAGINTEAARLAHRAVYGKAIIKGELKANFGDRFEIGEWNQLNEMVSEEIRNVQGASDLKVRLMHERGPRPPDEPPTFGTWRDFSPGVIRAKRTALAKYAKLHGRKPLTVREYDQMRFVLEKVEGRRRHAHNIANTIGGFGADGFHEKFLAERQKWAEQEGRKHFLALVRANPSLPLEDLWSKFLALYGEDGLLKHDPLPISDLQQRVLEDYFKYHTGVADFSDDMAVSAALQANGTEVPMDLRWQFVEHQQMTGAWNPRSEEVVERLGAWSEAAEADYWMASYRVRPAWLDHPEAFFREQAVHDAELARVGLVNPEGRANLRLAAPAKSEQLRWAAGDPKLGIRARRSLERQRAWAIERYGARVYDFANKRMIDMPWLMKPEELAPYVAALPEKLRGRLGLTWKDAELERMSAVLKKVLDRRMPHFLQVVAEAGMGNVVPVDMTLIHAFAFEVGGEMLRAGAGRAFWSRDLIARAIEVWSKFWRGTVFSQLGFVTSNAGDAPLRAALIRVNRMADMRSGEYGDRLIEGMHSIGLGEMTSLSYSSARRGVFDRLFLRPRDIADVRDMGNALLDVWGDGWAQIAGPFETHAKLGVARDMATGIHDQLGEEMLRALGSQELVDLAIKKMVKHHIESLFPTMANAGPVERLLNEFAPFFSYNLRNHVVWVREIATHPVWFNRIRLLQRYFTGVNQQDWERTHPGEPLPERLIGKLQLGDVDGFHFTLDPGLFTDVTRGAQPLYQQEQPLGKFLDSWFRILQPNQRALMNAITDGIGWTFQYKWVTDDNGVVTKVKVPIGNPWNEQPWAIGDLLWPQGVADLYTQLTADGELSQADQIAIVSKTMFFGEIGIYTPLEMAVTHYFHLKGQAKYDFEKTEMGKQVLLWLAVRAAMPKSYYIDPGLYDSDKNDLRGNYLRNMTRAQGNRLHEGWDARAALNEKFDTLVAAATTKEDIQALKSERRTEMLDLYRKYPEMLEYQSLGVDAQGFMADLPVFKQDEALDQFYALFGTRDKSVPYKEWAANKAAWLKAHPSVQQTFDAEATAYSRAKDLIFTRGGQALDRIAARKQYIDAAREAKRYDEVERLYAANEVDSLVLGEETLGDQGAARGGFDVVRSFQQVIRMGRTPGERQQEVKDQAYRDAMKGVIDRAKRSGNFGKSFYEQMMADDGLRRQYFEKHPGVQHQWHQNRLYFHAVMRFGKLKHQGKWQAALDQWEAWPDWMKAKYTEKHGHAGISQRQVAYMGWMGRWVATFKGDKKRSFAFFDSMPAWVKNQYFDNNPNSNMNGNRHSAYTRYLDRFFHAMDQKQYDLAQKTWEGFPSWVRDRYIHDHPKSSLADGWGGRGRSTPYSRALDKFFAAMDRKDYDGAEKIWNGYPKWVREKYIKAHPNSSLADGWGGRGGGKPTAYSRALDVFFNAMDKKDFDGAQKAWEGMPAKFRARYIHDHPHSSLADGWGGKTAGSVFGSHHQGTFTHADYRAYHSYMKRWVDDIDANGMDHAKALFRTFPKWVQDRYVKVHPDKNLMRYDDHMTSQLAQYYLSDEANRDQYLLEHPQVAKWLHENDSVLGRNSAILYLYGTLDDPWQKRVFRERYPEVFSAEAKGQKRIEGIMAKIAAHPEISQGFLDMLQMIWSGAAEAQKHSLGRGPIVEPVHPRPRRTRVVHRHRSLSAALTSEAA